MKTIRHFVLTATIAATSSAAFAQQNVPPPPVAPPRVPGAPPPPAPPAPPTRPEPPALAPAEPRRDPPSRREDEPRGERRREVPPPPALQTERGPDRDRREGGDRRAGDSGERRDPLAEQRDANARSEIRRQPEPVERERRRGPFFGFSFTPDRPLKPTPYLGVVTAPVPPVLAAQLGLREGFGLVVNEVLPGSPAATAGVQKHDVLKLLNDQQLVDPNQFATLVRSMGKDNEATVTLLRHGQEQKVTIKIGERMLPERRAEALDPNLPTTVPTFKSRWEVQGPDRLGPLPQVRAHPPETQLFRQKMREYQEGMRHFEQRLRDWQKNPNSPIPAPPPVPVMDPSSTAEPLGPNDILREMRPGGAAELRIVQPDGSTTFHTNQARLVIKDTDGEIEMTGENGRRVINVRDAAGKSIYSGPVDTTEQRNAVPEPFRGKMEKMIIKTSPGESSARVEAKASPAAEAPTDFDVQ